MIIKFVALHYVNHYKSSAFHSFGFWVYLAGLIHPSQVMQKCDMNSLRTIYIPPYTAYVQQCATYTTHTISLLKLVSKRDLE